MFAYDSLRVYELATAGTLLMTNSVWRCPLVLIEVLWPLPGLRLSLYICCVTPLMEDQFLKLEQFFLFMGVKDVIKNYIEMWCC
jgi:hypothetical protein